MPLIRSYPEATSLEDTDAFVIDRIGVGTMFIEAGSALFDMPFEYLGATPGMSEVLGLYTAVRAQQIFANFDGTADDFQKARGNVIVPPADGDYIVSVYLNAVSGSAVGTMTIAQTTGAYTFATTAGLVIDMVAGDYISFVGPVTPDSQIEGLTWTITGTNP